MATLKQQQAAKNIVENHGNVYKGMVDAGYDPTTAKNPKNLLDSKGFMELMDSYGLTDDLIITSLTEDIKTKPGNRTPELQLAVKMRGRMTEKLDLGGKLEIDNGIADPLVAAQFAEYMKNNTKT